MSVQRNYKDRLFRRLFGGEDTKENLLMLYNALNGTDYVNADDLTVNTIEDVIYMKMKNDVSCIVDGRLSLFEHQSTFSPNLPVRGMMYFAKMYDRFIEENHLDIYGKALVKLPTPQYYVIYNGEEDQPDVMEPKLSDAFERPVVSGEFEWSAIMYNINAGHNRELLEKCKPLADYQSLVEKIRENHKGGDTPEEAVDNAVVYCISHGILDKYLLAHRAEVIDMVLTEYNEELHSKTLRQEGYDEGLSYGLSQGLSRGKSELINEMLKMGHSPSEIARFCGLSQEEVSEMCKMSGDGMQ